MRQREKGADTWRVEMWLHPMLRDARPARARVFREILSVLQQSPDPIVRAGDTWSALLAGGTAIIGPLASQARCASVAAMFKGIKGLVVRPRRM